MIGGCGVGVGGKGIGEMVEGEMLTPLYMQSLVLFTVNVAAYTRANAVLCMSKHRKKFYSLAAGSGFHCHVSCRNHCDKNYYQQPKD